MTDIRAGGLARETLLAETGVLRGAALVRETLISGASTAAHMRVAGMAREALLEGTAIVPPSGARQYAVSVIS